jgi:hypothetical protein
MNATAKTLLGLSLFAYLTAAPLAAQEEGGSTGMPTYTGLGKVSEPLDSDKGALFNIGSGITMLFPRGLPVGHSRLVTLEKGKKKPAPNQVKPGFKAEGPVLEFNGALSTSREPIVLAMTVKKDPYLKGHRLVLAMEVGGFCEEHNKQYKLKSGLCSDWQFIDAEYDEAGKRVVARLNSTGGLRMQFGNLPDEPAAGKPAADD